MCFRFRNRRVERYDGEARKEGEVAWSRERFSSSEKEIDEQVIDCKLRTVSALMSIPVTVIASTSAVVVYRLFLIFLSFVIRFVVTTNEIFLNF